MSLWEDEGRTRSTCSKMLLKQVAEKEDSAVQQRHVVCALQTRKLLPQRPPVLCQQRGARRSAIRAVSAVWTNGA